MWHFFPSAKVSFAIESAQEIQQQAHIQVVAQNLYNRDASRTPVLYVMLDRRMVCSIVLKLINKFSYNFQILELQIIILNK